MERFEGAAVVSLYGQHDLSTAEAVGDALDVLIEGGERNVVVDLSGVQAVDSTVVGFLFSRARRLEKNSGRMALCALPREIRESFELMGVQEFIPIYEDRHGALLAGSEPGRPVDGVAERRKGDDRRRVQVPVEFRDQRESDRRTP
jgi:anti-anti-sigma factor